MSLVWSTEQPQLHSETLFQKEEEQEPEEEKEKNGSKAFVFLLSDIRYSVSGCLIPAAMPSLS